MVEPTRALGVKMGKRVQAQGVPCALGAGDARDGRDRQGRADVAAENGQEAAQVPADPGGSLREPRLGMPPQRGQRGRPRTRLRVRSGPRPPEGRAVAPHPQTGWQRGQGRRTDRGWWPAACAVRRGWSVAAGQRPRAAWVVRRRQSAGDGSSTRRTAPPDPKQACLMAARCRRSCTERPWEDAQTERGWDACQAQQ
jgi:hypothetical protein